MKGEECPVCEARVGSMHEPGCEVEICPKCGGSLISCGCGYKQNPRDRNRICWSGSMPGAPECHEYGFFLSFIKGTGWVRCAKGTEGARCDLNRLKEEARWDEKLRKWVLKEKNGTDGNEP